MGATGSCAMRASGSPVAEAEPAYAPCNPASHAASHEHDQQPLDSRAYTRLCRRLHGRLRLVNGQGAGGHTRTRPVHPRDICDSDRKPDGADGHPVEHLSRASRHSGRRNDTSGHRALGCRRCDCAAVVAPKRSGEAFRATPRQASSGRLPSSATRNQSVVSGRHGHCARADAAGLRCPGPREVGAGSQMASRVVT